MTSNTRKKPFHEPPIQRRHAGYGLALPLVRSGVTRFHRIERIEGLENLGDPQTPTIFVANHQNGLMDPLVLSSLYGPQQIHWLTRADIFYQRVARALLFSFNQMPIFRQRDKLSDARERNERVFKICSERLNIGATMGLFPEGNHRAVKSLRMLRRGVVDMVNQAIQLNPEMKRLRIQPVGIDYEEMQGFRRRLTYRIGPAISFIDMVNPETGQVTPGELLVRIHSAMNDLMVNIQPESHYEDLLPFVQSLRTAEVRDWPATRDLIRSLGEASEEALNLIREKHLEAKNAGVFDRVRPEDLGQDQSLVRSTPWWFWPLAPFAIIGGVASWPFSKWVQTQAQQRVKDPCFTSTFKVSIGMFLLPVYWFALAWPLAWMFTGDWGGMGTLAAYLFNLIGSRIAGWWYGHYLDWRGRQKAHSVYAQPHQAAAWNNYLIAVRQAAQTHQDSTSS